MFADILYSRQRFPLKIIDFRPTGVTASSLFDPLLRFTQQFKSQGCCIVMLPTETIIPTTTTTTTTTSVEQFEALQHQACVSLAFRPIYRLFIFSMIECGESIKFIPCCSVDRAKAIVQRQLHFAQDKSSSSTMAIQRYLDSATKKFTNEP